MKPSLLATGVVVCWLCAEQGASAQTPVAGPAPLLHSGGITMAKQWGTLPPPGPLPYGYWWDEYRGADIEHPLYAPRPHCHPQRPGGGMNPVSALCCWFNKLFHDKGTSPAAVCHACQVPVVPLPPVPVMPLMPESTPADSYGLEPAPLPLPIPTPPIPSEPLDPPGSISRPLADPPAPMVLVPPTNPPAIVEAPQIPVEGPGERPNEPPTGEDRQLPAARAPVVELAPEFPVPREPAAADAPPGASPGASRTAPRNVIPPAKRGILPGT